ncbi:class A sortase [Lactococcus petauri]|uniref:Class A sortase n=1 Tax=Lactococcus petauri TaxID=1940789 RepID=A0AAJ2IYK8_9LACT|nr:class A sortase [Lactococcus petauri]MDT2527143.1 class A sortase [Lactococcus petauri]MDT2541742.1 class A sortase [Lactococcus petauri]MDT2560450.1 class A sortase [Lactococcus petauri]MDT2568968.1 class A sortase [Lactococcus petauri]MDT2587930.1 class A sortase [Lactococcus petauri]
MKKNFSLTNIAIAVSVIAFLFGLLVFFSPNIGQHLIKSKASKEISISHVEMKKNLQQKGKFIPEDVRPLTTTELLANQFSKTDLPGIGIISIPDINLELPVFNGITYETMMYGAGTAKPNQQMGKGNYALASHTIFNSFNGSITTNLLFGNLIYTQIGQSIFLTDKDKSYEYKINNIYRVDVSQGNIIEDHKDKKEITLYTCTTLTGDERLVVYGTLVNTTKYKG